ncbi:uncharacterized protein LOC126371180 isoform X4 [Pectinophora gossypiella]|uniref:uncharacterized protein LOC126371180 isoform X4 n=1 Tax=Pectinophora gossypiella TaxID=13191 RepID=UPI00214E73D9|nr:uncharacterized protein LOC126371180 isoform X4 [Pectinophora gossypiella]
MRDENESDVPECLNRRYRVIDELIHELNAMSPVSTQSGSCATSNPGVRLMCKFWNILKEEPNCNLPDAVHRCMYLSDDKVIMKPQNISCYMANEDQRSGGSRPAGEGGGCCSGANSNAPPLSKVLGNLKEAASFDRDCNRKLRDLLTVEKQLRCQIARLETREKEGIALLKKADDMWSSMENAYKEKIAESLERQRDLVKELHEIETSAAKWRKNKKDLEKQLEAINKCQVDMTEKINQKTNDLKSIDAEITGYKSRIEKTKKETESTRKQLSNKKIASDGRLSKICEEITKIEKEIQEETKRKQEKEKEGNGFIKGAREDLQKMCKMLLQKKLEHEDLKAEKVALIQEINMLKDTCDNCKDRCAKKQQSIFEEIKNVDTEIYDFKLKCVRCNVCIDTSDVRKFCIDCPRCEQQRECLMEGGTCSADAKEECVCMTVKQRFLDNVFENMYTVLEKQIRTDAGKVVAEEIADCLKKSRNGKLNEHTRRILQDFILTTVKKNLNLTIVGGAVKTRCELDTAMYEQLMLCLKKVKATPTPKSDKGTDVKKDPCFRWGGPSECNCPKGPKACICSKKAPPPVHDPTPCPPPEKEDAGEIVVCPHKQNVACGPDCGSHTPNKVGKDVAKWRPDPCAPGQSCPFGKNMRAAQCVLGPESLIEPIKFGVPTPQAPSYVLQDQIECKCGKSPMKPCTCSKDQRTIPRQKMIEEVMGRYLDVMPIEKVSFWSTKTSPSDTSS